MSDVIAGAILGSDAASRMRERSEKTVGVINPILAARTYGLSISARY